MSEEPDSPTIGPTLSMAPVPIVRPLRPLIYNFFVSERPENLQQTLDELESINYRSFHSSKIESKAGQSFKPTLQFKKLVDEPKFLLSVERKKIKIMQGINQRASSERPSRNCYRGKKLRSSTAKTINPEEFEMTEEGQRDRRIESQEPMQGVSPRKTKQPHLHFNLNYMLQTRKHFTGQFSRE
jgi:hypothetical protein